MLRPLIVLSLTCLLISPARGSDFYWSVQGGAGMYKYFDESGVKIPDTNGWVASLAAGLRFGSFIPELFVSYTDTDNDIGKPYGHYQASVKSFSRGFLLRFMPFASFGFLLGYSYHSLGRSLNRSNYDGSSEGSDIVRLRENGHDVSAQGLLYGVTFSWAPSESWEIFGDFQLHNFDTGGSGRNSELRFVTLGLRFFFGPELGGGDSNRAQGREREGAF